jgi:cytochrome d ubiquinol oxidase subunit II
MSYDALCLIWFVLLGVLLAGYAVLDGFDLGVGILHPLARNDRERRVMMNAIGPLWDGNEVWLITYGGALFAAFPTAYATIFSGFYVAFMLLLFALIFRAVSMEFRSKMQSPTWRRFWDWCFFGASALATLLFGVAAGNGMLGVELNANGQMISGFFDLLHPYAVLVGLFTVSMFAMHGAIFLNLKTEGQLQDRLRDWMWHTWGIFLVLYILTTMYTLVAVPRATANFEHMPWAAIVVVINVLAIANIPRSFYAGRPGQAFISSSLAIIGFIVLFSVALFPNIVTSRGDGLSLTIFDPYVASSKRTLTIMLIIAVIGMPLVLAYTSVIYWTFRGKVQIGEHSY